MKILAILTLATAVGSGFAACEKKGPAERAGEKIDKAVEKTGDKAAETGNKIGEAAEKTGKKIDDALGKK